MTIDIMKCHVRVVMVFIVAFTCTCSVVRIAREAIDWTKNRAKFSDYLLSTNCSVAVSSFNNDRVSMLLALITLILKS